MLIQCLFDCPEDGIYLGGETYHFRPEHDRICEVRIKAHQEHLLSRTRSYRAVAEPELVPATPQAVMTPVTALPEPKRRSRRFTSPTQAVLMPDDERD